MIQRLRDQRGESALPVWLNIVVVLTLLALLAYNILVNGAEGLPNSYIIGGLLGAYIGAERLIRRPNGGNGSSTREPLP